jgi:hypothetical protein
VRFIRQAHLLQRDRHLNAVGRRVGIKLGDRGVFGGPTGRDREA